MSGFWFGVLAGWVGGLALTTLVLLFLAGGSRKEAPR